MDARKIHQALLGTKPNVAEKAIGMLIANAEPRTNWGRLDHLFTNGYRVARKTAAIDNWTVKKFVINTKPNDIRIKKENRINAPFSDISPEVKGRSLVLITNLSIFRSAKSLITQPADLIKITPSVNMISRSISGKPLFARNKPQSVGQSNRYIPIGLSNRINLKYAFTRPP